MAQAEIANNLVKTLAYWHLEDKVTDNMNANNLVFSLDYWQFLALCIIGTKENANNLVFSLGYGQFLAL